MTPVNWSKVLSDLQDHYRAGPWRVPVLRSRGANPFHVLVSTVLSQRTRDEVTERSSRRLLAAYPTPRAMAVAPLQRIQKLVREVGLAQNKARALRDASRMIVEQFGGEVPRSRDELLRLPMVGPKTAHAIMVFAHEKPGLPVDTHILRVTQRLGVVKGKTIPEAQRELARSVPKRFWGLLNPVLVQHGQNLCSAHNPRCDECPILEICPQFGVARADTRP